MDTKLKDWNLLLAIPFYRRSTVGILFTLKWIEPSNFKLRLSMQALHQSVAKPSLSYVFLALTIVFTSEACQFLWDARTYFICTSWWDPWDVLKIQVDLSMLLVAVFLRVGKDLVRLGRTQCSATLSVGSAVGSQHIATLQHHCEPRLWGSATLKSFFLRGWGNDSMGKMIADLSSDP